MPVAKMLPSHSYRLLHSRPGWFNEGTYDKATCRKEESREACKALTSMQKEERNDSSGTAEQHRNISPQDGSAFRIESSNNANKSAGKKDGTGDVEVQIHRTGRRVIQTPE